MPTYTAPMHTDAYMRKCVVPIRSSTHPRINGFTLIELIIVVLMVSLFVLLAVVNLFGLLGRNTFRAQVQELVSTMQMAASAAAESDRRYEVIIDLIEQSYTLRQISGTRLSQDMEGEVIVQNELGDNCWIAYVEFDDGEYTNDGRVWFWVGRSGWQYGGKIVLLDSNENQYSVLVNRINRIVTLQEGDVELLTPKRQEEVPF